MNQFNIGDKVILKSDGPTMTIEEYDENFGQYICRWFDSKGNIQQGMFKPETLKFYEPPTLKFY